MPARTPSTNLVRYLPFAGGVLSGITVIGLSALFAASATQAIAVVGGLLVLGYAGKEAALPVGIAAGANPILMGAFIFLVDVAVTCFLYPPLHYAIQSWMQRPGFIGQYLRYVRDKGGEGRSLIVRYGTFGLFLFMLIPFAINGPLVGAVLGRLMGLRARQIIPTLFTAVGVTCVIWTCIYGFGFLVMEEINPALPKLVAIVVVLAVIAHGVVAFHHVRRNGRGGATPAPGEPDAAALGERTAPEPA